MLKISPAHMCYREIDRKRRVGSLGHILIKDLNDKVTLGQWNFCRAGLNICGPELNLRKWGRIKAGQGRMSKKCGECARI